MFIVIYAASWNLQPPLAIKFTQHELATLGCDENSNGAASKI